MLDMVTDTEVRVDLPRDDPKLSQSMTAPHNEGRPTMFRTEVMGSPIVIRGATMTCSAPLKRGPPCAFGVHCRSAPQRVLNSESRVSSLHRATAQVHKSLTGLVAGSSTPAPFVRSPHRYPISHLLSLSIYQLPSLIHPSHLHPSSSIFNHDVCRHQGSRSPGQYPPAST